MAVKRGNVVEFPLQPIDLDRVGLQRDAPCLILVLPVVRIERCEERATSWLRRILDSARPDGPDRVS